MERRKAVSPSNHSRPSCLTQPQSIISSPPGRSYYDNPEIEGGGEDREGAGQPSLDEGSEEDSGPWYIGKAREEFNRRRRGGQSPSSDRNAHDEDDPVQWARERRQAEADRDRDGDYGPEDYFEGAIRGQRYREEDGEVDEFAETMLLVVLCLLVSVLLYVRGRWVDRLRREEEERRREQQAGQQQQQRPNGVFPPPGDPARDDWAVLR